ncbi:MAG: hypothetical protein DRQ48_00200 [Gammaproteobacteria bacterium]|nr:MAG: hypothetical protein DRQ48_00200 [Gammaproteobacteria bacterium]
MKELNEATLADLVEYHNELAEKAGEKPVKRFKSKATGLAAIEAMEARKGQINWPFSGEVKHKVRPNTLRGQILAALQDGATGEALKAIMVEHNPERENPEGHVRGVMRTLHRYNGYGIRQDGDSFSVVEA